MGGSGHLPMEEMDLFLRYVAVAEWGWKVVGRWPPLAVDTVGKQLIRSLDRVGATLVEGTAAPERRTPSTSS